MYIKLVPEYKSANLNSHILICQKYSIYNFNVDVKVPNGSSVTKKLKTTHSFTFGSGSLPLRIAKFNKSCLDYIFEQTLGWDNSEC